jgi:pimeloyl-ACP methyl ester carboxylesterase
VIRHHHLESPILVGHSWGGFLSLNFLERHPGVAKGLVMVCSPIDYPESFRNILKRVHKMYDGMRSMLRMNHFPRMREIEKLMKTMFPADKPRAQNLIEREKFVKCGYYNFELDDVAAVFVHARMLDFSAPLSLLTNSGYRELTDRLASLKDSELFLSFDEQIGGYFYKSTDPQHTVSVFERDNIDLLERMFTQYNSRVHAIYSDDDRMYSKRQVTRIQETLNQSSRRHFSYIYGAGHYPFLEQNRQFLDVLIKHLERMR